MGTAAKKKRAMRSRRSGVKKMTQIKANLAILKTLTLLLIVMLVGCVPVKTVHTVHVGHYHNYYQRHSFTTYSYPFWIPGRGVMLQTYPAPMPYHNNHPKTGRH